MRPFHRPIALLIGVALLAGWSVTFAASGGASPPTAPRAARLIVKPNPVPLNLRVVVIVTGLRRDERVQFTARPASGGFSGGNMGTHRAGKNDTIEFSYPGFTQRRELGVWIVTARRANGSILQTHLTVVEQPTPVPTPVYPPLARVQRWRLALPAQMDFQPTVAGNTVAYATTACRSYRLCRTVLYLAQLSSPRVRQIEQIEKYTSNLTLQLSSTWLVWLTERYPAPGWQLWAWSRRTSQRRLIDSSATEGGPAAPGYPEVSLSGNVLAWVRHDCLQHCTRPGPSTLRLIDLTGGTATVVAHLTYVCRQISFPALSDTTLSWVSTPLSGWGCPAPQTWTVMSRDRHTSHVSFHEIHLSRNQTADEFTGYRGWEAWSEHLEHTNQDTRVLLMNLRSGAQRTISGYGGYSPRLAGRVLAWIGYARIEALDLDSGKRYLLAHEVNGRKQDVALGVRLGESTRGKVIWVESTFNHNGGLIRHSLVVASVP